MTDLHPLTPDGSTKETKKKERECVIAAASYAFCVKVRDVSTHKCVRTRARAVRRRGNLAEISDYWAMMTVQAGGYCGRERERERREKERGERDTCTQGRK